ncbi:MAG: hypothetical protein KF823_10710 [Xanthomonadales bacterium]|nr:hypothetical protein [Xanthomonadales bacterium]
MRRPIFAALVLAWSALLLALFVPLRPGDPPRPAQSLAIPGERFASAIGQARARDGGLHVTAMAGANGALQVHAPTPFRAEELPILRYRFEGLPRTLELTFVFRRADQPDDVRVMSLPGVGTGEGAVDLSASPHWRGTITEIGLAEYPGAQSVPPGAAFRPFTLRSVELQSPSWSGALAARRHDWFGRQNWELLSLSAIGPDSPQARGWPLPVLLALAATGAWLAGVLVLGWRGRRAGQAALLLAAIGWLLLDLRWLHNFHGRHQATRVVYAGLDAGERAALQPDQAAFDAAARVREALAGMDSDTRVFVDAGSDYQRARLLYHLLPLNVAPVNLVTYGTPAQRAGAVVVLFDARAPRWQPEAGLLHFADVAMAAEPIVLDGALRIFRLGEAP